jgi:4'-phosphopantetheinyl transferase EntD
VIEAILPGWAATAESFGDLPDAAPLGPEAAAVAGAVPVRRREFATGRECARQALAGLGVPPVPIPRGERGQPMWPPGVTGSITHCAGYRAAAVAPAARAAALGIDAEPDESLPSGVLDLVCLPAEREALSALAAVRPELSWERLLFSAKESVYKAWYPLTGRWLDFTEAMLTIDADGGTFAARLLVPGPLPGFTGRWLAGAGLLLTAVVVPALEVSGRLADRQRGEPVAMRVDEAPDGLGIGAGVLP